MSFVCVNSWEGSGVNEVGKDKATGRVRVRINPKYYRPTEVVRVPATCTCLSLIFTVRLCEAYTHGIAVEILSVRPSVRLSNACIVTKRKHLAKKVQL